MDKISASLLWDIFKHVRSWLANLHRAGQDRQQQSIRALRDVITAARETAVYIRQMKDTGQRDHGIEARLSVLWTELGFSLQDLGISKLAKRCQINGKHWSNPEHYDEDFLARADVSLERMENLANQILRQLKR
jgi:hypothetical protein